ncbi:MAG TPA: TIGR03435 family protein [Candidatus Acidoferrales bacterium]
MCALFCLASFGIAIASALATQTQRPPEGGNSSTPDLKFEVVSIRPLRVGEGRTMVRMGWVSPDEFRATGVSILDLIEAAYGIHQDAQLIGTPDWVKHAFYEVDAKTNSATSNELNNPAANRAALSDEMLRTILANRFQLAAHRETRILAAYVLKIAKGGPKLHESKPGGPQTFRTLIGELILQGQTMEPFVEALSERQELGNRPVINRTDLTGRYDFTLRWTPEGSTRVAPGAPPPDTSGISIFTALREQLGLRLEATKAPIDVVVIDHVEEPTPN